MSFLRDQHFYSNQLTHINHRSLRLTSHTRLNTLDGNTGSFNQSRSKHMKNLRLRVVLCLSVLMSTLANAQITITMADVQGWFAVGKSWMFYHEDSPATTMDVKAASSSAQSWTLPTVQYTDTTRQDNVAPGSTPYSSEFPSSTHCQRTIQMGDGITFTFYSYSRIVNDSLIFLGEVTRVQGGQPADTTIITKRTRTEVTFPVTVGYSHTSRDSIPFGPGSYDIETRTETFDAHGTMTVGSSMYTVLRSKSVEITVQYSSGVEVGRDTSTSFFWIAKEGILIDANAADNTQTSGTIPLGSITLQVVINTPTLVTANSSLAPETFELLQNYPNPFNPSTTIEFSLRDRVVVKLAVFNILGEEIAVLMDGSQSAGLHRVAFDAKGLPSGMYTYRLTSSGAVKSGKMLLVR